ncbi:SDR family oxidoreductase [Mesorhizobium sp. BAC0120]|uniref:SDR family NAD(P)-dependent oxidoreductase n=1 Tax=Mesorhizobium sp. BAC0120 TaxID=3090670 RepID=UPI00298C9F10|nr:SDR family oxidoreductase [Mesorhizobium sp. BAC0120]MDW6021882.1 SDR family oxidoreductase [Mesorhizobium sp. BAC0120]
MTKPCVCISGSTQGIGFAIAEAFARTGARLVINSHVPDRTAREQLSGLTECHFVQADLSTVEGARGFVAEAHKRLGRLDTLVNNAGTFCDADFEELSETIFDRTFNLNVRGYLFAAQAFVRHLSPGQENASIICVGSTNSLAAEKNSVVYDASKGAVLMLIRSMAVTLAPRGVRVNGLGPGIIDTPLTRAGLDRAGVRPGLAKQIPLGRIGEANDIGTAAVFLASEGARYVTGQMLYVDGGVLANQMTWPAAG